MSRIIAAAWVIARRDFLALVRSKAFIAFLVGPIVMLTVALAAGGIAAHKASQAVRPQIGISMNEADTERMLVAGKRLEQLVEGLPELVSAPGPASPELMLRDGQQGRHFAAILSGSLDKPRLDTTEHDREVWPERMKLLIDQARRTGEGDTVALEVHSLRTAPATPVLSQAQDSRAEDRSGTAQFGQMALFLATMLLAGMVLSNMVEEKANKIIEILASAVPLESIFLGKLFAMLAMALIAIAIWVGLGLALVLFAGSSLPELAPPAVGWPVFLLLGTVYFSMAYLLLGSAYLAIGAMAATVRDVQTLSMPVSMAQLGVFLLASYAMAQPGTAVEAFACLIPWTSPFAALARAAQDPALWPHAALILWQAAWTWVIIRIGTGFFRRHVLKSRGSRRAAH